MKMKMKNEKTSNRWNMKSTKPLDYQMVFMNKSINGNDGNSPFLRTKIDVQFNGTTGAPYIYSKPRFDKSLSLLQPFK